MTKEKAMEILSKAFSRIFNEITFELEQKKVDIEQEILMSQNIEEIKSLVEKVNTIDTALEDVSHREDVVMTFISSKDTWYNYSLLCDLNCAFRWLLDEDEAE